MYNTHKSHFNEAKPGTQNVFKPGKENSTQYKTWFDNVD